MNQKPVRITITELKQIAKDSGSHFFDRDTIRFFKSRMHGQPYRLRNGLFVFITSEKPLEDIPRVYSVRFMEERRPNDPRAKAGCFFNVIAEYPHLDDAREAISKIVAEDRQ